MSSNSEKGFIQKILYFTQRGLRNKCKRKVMHKNKLGKFGPELSEIGLGTWAIGGPWQYGWGEQNEKDSLAAIEASLEMGINWIDTAAVYGLGHAETLIGKALKGKRENIVVASKCGLVWDEQGNTRRDSSPASIRKECEDSLRRLQSDYIDLYQIHWPDAGIPFERSWQEMLKLKQEGKIRYAGVSNYNRTMLEQCQEVGHVDSVQPPYSMIRRYVEQEVLPWAYQNGSGVIAYSPTESGLLSGKYNMQKLQQLPKDDWRKNNRHYSEEQLTKIFALVEDLKFFASEKGTTVFDLAVAWVLHHPAVTAAIVGARNEEQARKNAEGSGAILSADDMHEIEKIWRKNILGKED